MLPATTDSIDIFINLLPYLLTGAAGMFVGLGVGYWIARKDIDQESGE